MNPHGSTADTAAGVRFARIRDLFDRAQEVPTEHRRAFLEKECAGDGPLLASTLELVEAGSRVGDRFDPDRGSMPWGVEDPPRPASMPTQIGPYRIRRLIGRGGMGVVYLAEQHDPDREVALKILGCERSPRATESRFRREVRVLARLEHPGITRLYEAGTAQTTSGPVSYFAMEYVRGPNLADYVRHVQPGFRGTLELMARIADAVQHAHAKGVIHCDLKPANILVHAEGVPSDAAGPGDGGCPQTKILDFGVARLLEPDTRYTAINDAGMLIGTVAYMSPEQLGGDADAVDARTDVYTLGVILYELLAGRSPHDVSGQPIAAAARIIMDEAPAPLNSGPGGPDRDLQAIVARAMEKDRERRYPTAAAFADDLRRYLRHEPILARPATVVYQLSKFARRHRRLVAAAAVAVMALLAGVVVSTTLYARERQARRLADRNERISSLVQDYMINDLLLAAAPERLGFDATILDMLHEAADGLHERFADQPEIEARMRTALAGVFASLGKPQKSEEQWALAVPLLDRTAGPDDPRTISALVRHSGVLHQLRRPAASLEAATDALNRARRSLPAADALTVQALAQIGIVHLSQGRSRTALNFLREGLALAEQAPQKNIQTMVGLRTAINECLRKSMATGDAVEASRDIATDAGGELGMDSPTAVTARSNLILALLREDRVEEAVAIAEELPAAAERAFASGHLQRGHALRNSADALRRAGRSAEAEGFALQANQIFAAVFPELNAEHEVCFEVLRHIYAEWPGHQDELRLWSVRSIRARLMLAPPERLISISRLLKDIEAQSGAAGQPLSRTQWIDLVWSQRDDLAPPGHPRRAAFFANLARAGAKLDHREHLEEAVRLAEASLPDAAKPGVAAKLVQSARRVVDAAPSN